MSVMAESVTNDRDRKKTHEGYPSHQDCQESKKNLPNDHMTL